MAICPELSIAIDDKFNLSGDEQSKVEDMPENFPEFASFRPINALPKEKWWEYNERGRQIRIEILKQCIEMTKPLPLPEQSLSLFPGKVLIGIMPEPYWVPFWPEEPKPITKEDNQIEWVKKVTEYHNQKAEVLKQGAVILTPDEVPVPEFWLTSLGIIKEPHKGAYDLDETKWKVERKWQYLELEGWYDMDRLSNEKEISKDIKTRQVAIITAREISGFIPQHVIVGTFENPVVVDNWTVFPGWAPSEIKHRNLSTITNGKIIDMNESNKAFLSGLLDAAIKSKEDIFAYTFDRTRWKLEEISGNMYRVTPLTDSNLPVQNPAKTTPPPTLNAEEPSPKSAKNTTLENKPKPE